MAFFLCHIVESLIDISQLGVETCFIGEKPFQKPYRKPWWLR
ncbi:MAG: hypothetical protein OEW23_17145 [Candidatus Aminicenantes bacterium]|nr:hypothetical protein [Candidatus Aminicenantes bacterium]